jgi:hypothetical protein
MSASYRGRIVDNAASAMRELDLASLAAGLEESNAARYFTQDQAISAQKFSRELCDSYATKGVVFGSFQEYHEEFKQTLHSDMIAIYNKNKDLDEVYMMAMITSQQYLVAPNMCPDRFPRVIRSR